MKRKRGRILAAALLAAFLICLPSLNSRWKRAVYSGKFYDFFITNPYATETAGTMQGISCLQAEEILQGGADDNAAVPVVFYKVLKGQMLTNPEFGRSRSGTVYEIKGDSCLLFPDGFPLALEDTGGCLLSKRLAYELFGDVRITGTTVSFGGREYMVRGILQSEEKVFVRLLTEKDAVMDRLILKAGGYRMKEQYKERLGQYYGLTLEDRPTAFQRFHITTDMLPSRMSDFSEWVNFLKKIGCD